MTAHCRLTKLLVSVLLLCIIGCDGAPTELLNSTAAYNSNLRESRETVVPKFRFNEVGLDEDVFFFEFESVPDAALVHRQPGVPRMAGYFLLILEDNPLRTVVAADLASPCMAFDQQQYLVFGATQIGSFRNNAGCDSVIIDNVDHQFVFLDNVVYITLLVRSNSIDLQPLFPATSAVSENAVVFSDVRQTWKSILKKKSAIADAAVLCQKNECMELTEEGAEFVNELGRSVRVDLSIEPANVAVGASLNVCDESWPYQYKKLATSYATPGKVNDCTDNFLQGLPRAGCVLALADDAALCETDNPFEESFRKESALSDKTKFVSRGFSETNAKFQKQLDILRWWNPVDPENFQFSQCRNLFSHKGKILHENSVHSWLRLTRVENSVQCRIKCEACSQIFALGLRPDIRQIYRQGITTDQGIITKTTPYKNTETLKIHMSSPLHKSSMILSQKVHNSKNLEERKSVLLQYISAQQKLYMPTKAYLAFVYAQATSGIPFLVHEKLVKALELNGWGFGGVQSSRSAAVSAITSMSEYMRNQFLAKFVAETTRFSVIIDASTDSANIPYLVVLIQSISDQKVTISLYGMLRVKRENSAEMFAAVLNQINADEKKFPGTEARFKTSLTAVASDNAKVMVSHGKSMYSKFKQYTGRNLIKQGCANHNLELAFEKALKPDESYLSNFNTTYWKQFLSFYEKHNEFYNFYASRGNRRWQHFLEVCDQIGIKCKRFKQYLNIRWAESHYRVLEAIAFNMNAVIEDLNHWINIETTGNNEKFGVSLYNTITNLLYALVVRDQMDYLEIFRTISLKLQKRNLLIDSYKLIEKGVDDLIKLKMGQGPHLTRFLAACSCSKKCVVGQCNLVDIETCRKEVFCSGKKYTKNSLKLHLFREELIEQISGSMYDYFDIMALRGMKLFDFPEHVYEVRHGRYIPDSDEDIQFTRFCSYINIKENACAAYYKNYIEFLNRYGKQIQNQQLEKVSDYLIKLLNDASIELHPNVRYLIEVMTVLPAGSAEAERSFSFLNLYKTKRRFKLKPEILQHLLNLRINGPPVSNFDGDTIVEHYLQHHFRTDAIRQASEISKTEREQVTSESPDQNASLDEYEDDSSDEVIDY